MILNDEQEQALRDLEGVSLLAKSLRKDMQEEFERLFAERHAEVLTRRAALARYAHSLGVPKRRIGAALGTQDYYTVSNLLGAPAKERIAGSYSFSFGNDRVTITLASYVLEGTPWTGAAELALVGDEWMAADENDLSLACERAIFGPSPDEKMKEAFLAALPKQS